MVDDPPRASDPTIPDTASADTQAPTDRYTHLPLRLSGYELGDVIGRGGMGEVLAATDLRIERGVAVKRMRGHASPEAVARFLREAKIQAQLDHPAIVPVHELGADSEGRPFFTMKRLAGTTLERRLSERSGPGAGPLGSMTRGHTAMQPMLRALVDVGFAIGLAHDRGIVHRDLKPSNIMLGDYNEVYVLDWGVARVIKAARTSSLQIDSVATPGMTADGAMLGTPGYMAPEQMRGDDVGPPADVYSLGAILFEILAGEPLHKPGQAAIASTLATPTDAPAKRRADRDIPPELDELCAHALAEEPSQRPTARELAQRLQQYLDGDRDLERRRAIAEQELTIARDALASGETSKRRLAAQSAARALAFDPTSRPAADLVARLMLEPAPVDPPELIASLAAEEKRISADRSRRAIPAFLAVYIWLPFLLFIHVESWPALVALFGSCTVMAGIVALNARSGRVPVGVLFAGNLAVALAFSRLAGSFVLLPMLVCGQLLALSTHAWVEGRRWVLVAWSTCAVFIPLVLEQLGVLASTWHVDGSSLVTRGVIAHGDQTTDTVSLLFGQGTLAAVIALYAAAFSRTTRDAQRRAHRHAWHLQQMLPRGTSQLT
jgi:serine/threonine-protein kinase